jgi:hypothetical protein
MSTAHFYSKLKTSGLPYVDLLHDEHFHTPPEDWYVVIADIKNSTAAVERGAHNDVNLVAAGCLVAALNIARKRDLEVPFFFGGDGGTFLVPKDINDEVLTALHLHGRNSEEHFGLSLHLGAVPVAKVSGAGHGIRLAKTRIGTGFGKAVVVGDGLLWAERQVKGEQIHQEMSGNDMPDMMGLECRWDRISPPKPKDEVVCYLIEACDSSRQLEVYRNVLLHTDSLFGGPEHRSPLSTKRLKILASTKKIQREMKARFGRWKWGYYAQQMARTAAASLLLRNEGKIGEFNVASYLDELVSNADTLTIDGRINMIISGTPGQRHRFLEYLDEQEQAGILCYGHHINRQSVMTCYIQSRDKSHVHFVDGSDGGYTAASRELKKKLFARVPNP